MYETPLSSNAFVINDDNWEKLCGPQSPDSQYGRGYVERDWAAQPLYSAGKPFPFPIMSREQQMEETERQNREESTLWHIMRRAGWRVKNQKTTPLCWSFATVGATEASAITDGQPYVARSPASIAGPITGYVYRGGWPTECLRTLAEIGVSTTEQWDDTTLDRRLYEASLPIRENFKMPEWLELKPRNMDEVMTALLMRIPVVVGLNWMGHAMFYCQPLWRNGKAACKAANSWSENWGEDGYGIFEGSRVIPDDACCPYIGTYSAVA